MSVVADDYSDLIATLNDVALCRSAQGRADDAVSSSSFVFFSSSSSMMMAATT
jgi:hypothetical protein